METLIELIHFKNEKYHSSCVIGPFYDEEVFNVVHNLNGYFRRCYGKNDRWHVQPITIIKPETQFDHDWEAIKRGEFK